MTYELIKRNYDRGLWTVAQVKVALDKGVITQKQFDEIIAEPKKK